MPPKIPAFVNPKAGSAAAARAALEPHDEFELVELEPPALFDAMRERVAAGAERVLVAGGDGTITSAAGVVAASDTALAILPGGTLNHFARDHRIPTDAAEAVQLAIGGAPHPVDVGYANDRVFLGTSSVGAYVRFVRTRERLERWMGYYLATVVAGFVVLARLRTYRVTLDVEGRERTYHTPVVFVGVGEREFRFPSLGSRKEGGRRGLHVLVVRGGRARRMLGLAMIAMTRGVRAAHQARWMDALVVDRVRIELPRHHASVGLDGEVVDLRAPLEYRIGRDAIRVVGAVLPTTCDAPPDVPTPAAVPIDEKASVAPAV